MRTGVLAADSFVLDVNGLVAQLTAPAVLVLDNALIHTAHLVRERHAAWAAAELTLLFLPPYSSELNNVVLPKSWTG